MDQSIHQHRNSFDINHRFQEFVEFNLTFEVLEARIATNVNIT